MRYAGAILCTVLLTCLWALTLNAQEFNSTSFKALDPVIFPGGYSTSTNFGLSAVVSQMAIGTSTATSFMDFAGFLYFPFVSTPTVSATAGDAQVSLTWTSADATLGWAVGGYSVGQSTVSGGPYSYANVGNVLASTRTSLTNSTPYYFVIRVQDALGNFIATSTEVTATPVAGVGGSDPGDTGGSGGSGGSGSTTGNTGVNFSGRAYPGSTVTVLKDAQLAITTLAGPDARFSVTLSGMNAAMYTFYIYSEDSSKRRSKSIVLPITLTAGAFTNISGLFLAPTIAVDKSEVKKGDDISIFGQSVGQANVTIQVNSDPMFVQAKADNDGVYLYNFDTAPLEMGGHSTKSKSATSSEISPYSAEVAFKVGTKNVPFADTGQCRIADFNCDGRVNLIDFSILLYWHHRANPLEKVDLKPDGKIDLVDFSILAYHWTG